MIDKLFAKTTQHMCETYLNSQNLSTQKSNRLYKYLKANGWVNYKSSWNVLRNNRATEDELATATASILLPDTTEVIVMEQHQQKHDLDSHQWSTEVPAQSQNGWVNYKSSWNVVRNNRATEDELATATASILLPDTTEVIVTEQHQQQHDLNGHQWSTEVPAQSRNSGTEFIVKMLQEEDKDGKLYCLTFLIWCSKASFLTRYLLLFFLIHIFSCSIMIPTSVIGMLLTISNTEICVDLKCNLIT